MYGELCKIILNLIECDRIMESGSKFNVLRDSDVSGMRKIHQGFLEGLFAILEPLNVLCVHVCM